MCTGMYQPEIKLEDPNKRKKRAYKPRDPNAPKRPLTAYFRYLGEVRNTISDELQKDPEKYKDVAGQPGDISKIATTRWQQMTEEQKAPYKQAYQDELKDYTIKAEEYQKAKGLPPGSLPGEGDASAAIDPDAESPAAIGTVSKTEGADDDDDDDDDDDSSGSSSSSEESDEDEPAPPPPPPPKATATPKKSAMKKKDKAAAAAPSAPQVFSSIPTPSFSSINNPPAQSVPEPPSSPSRKRKGDAGEDGAKASKRGKKAAPQSDPAPAVAPPVSSPEVVPEASGKKKEKKKKKSKGDA